MSRISSDPFRRALVATVIILSLLCGTFVVLNFLHGPKLVSAQVDLARVVAAPAQQLRLFANQPLADVTPAQVTIIPATGFSVSVDADVVAVQFTGPLEYNTDYSVTVNGVTNSFDAQASTLDYSFRTGAPRLYSLHRGATDQIVSSSLAGTGRSVVFESPGIQDFVRVRELLVVVLVGENDAGDAVSALRLVSLTDGGVETLYLPAEATIDELHATDAASILGFTLTTAGDPIDGKYDHTLFAVDLAAGRTILPLAGLDGKPLDAPRWLFVPGTTTIVAQTGDDSVVMLDASVTDAAVTPLGQFETLAGVSPDGSELTVTDRYGPIALDLATQEQTRLPASDFEGETPYGGDTLALPGGSRVQHIAVFDDETGRFAAYLVLDDGSSSRVLYRTVDDEGEIGDFSLSPNGQFVAVEIVPEVSERQSDGYAVNSRATTVTTVIVNLATGAVVRSLEGFALSW